MLHFVKNEKGEPTVWRDPEDIRQEMRRVETRISAAHECYATLEDACKNLNLYPEEEETRRLLEVLMGEAKTTLAHIDDACEEMNRLQKEMRDTRCLLLRI